MGIRGSVLSLLIQFLSNRPNDVMVDGCWSKLVIVSGVQQGSVWGLSLFLLDTSDLFFNLIDYADDLTLMAVVPSSGVIVTVAE